MIINNDCLDEMRKMEDNSISCIVTDPPYGLGFMGKEWDAGLPHDEIWKEALRVVKPGGHLLAFGGTRTFHRLTCAIEDAGWEIRDCLMWVYGSGFPKSHNIGKALDKKNDSYLPGDLSENSRNSGESPSGCFGKGVQLKRINNPQSELAKQFNSYGTALKPAYEPIILGQKPCEGTFAQNAEKWGQAGINIDGCRIGFQSEKEAQKHANEWDRNWTATPIHAFDKAIGNHPGAKMEIGTGPNLKKGRWPANVIFDEEAAEILGEPSRFFFIARKDKYDIISPWELAEESLLVGSKTGSGCSNPNTDMYGNKPTALFRPDTISIIEMGTRSIINFPILSASKLALIGNCTLDSEKIIKQSEALYIEAVSIAENGECLIHFQKGRTEPIKAIVRNVLQRSLENGEETTESIGTNTIEKDASKQAINTIRNISIKTESESMLKEENATVKRFFYCAKTSSRERNEGLEGMPDIECQTGCGGDMPIDDGGKERDRFKKIAKNHHPTVKPLKLMKYLITLIMPPKDGILLDPFAGSGSTILAARQLGVKAIGIEKSAEYCNIARKRIENWKPDLSDPDLFESKSA